LAPPPPGEVWARVFSSFQFALQLPLLFSPSPLRAAFVDLRAPFFYSNTPIFRTVRDFNKTLIPPLRAAPCRGPHPLPRHATQCDTQGGRPFFVRKPEKAPKQKKVFPPTLSFPPPPRVDSPQPYFSDKSAHRRPLPPFPSPFRVKVPLVQPSPILGNPLPSSANLVSFTTISFINT